MDDATKKAYRRKGRGGWEKTLDKMLGAQNEHVQTMNEKNPNGRGADARARYYLALGISE